MSRAENILVRGVNWLGDAVMTTPALQRLRQARPHARISLLTHDKLSALWHAHPSIDAVITFAAGEGVWSVARRLRAEKFDTAIVFPNSPRAALEVFCARIPHRIGYARNWRRLFLTQALPRRSGSTPMRKRSVSDIQQRVAANLPRETFPPGAHHVHDYLHLVAAVGANELPIAPLLEVAADEVAAVRTRFALRDDFPLFGINAGAEYGAAKRWPAERFVEAAVQLHMRTRCDWLILGGPGDRVLAEKLASEIRTKCLARVTNVAGETSLRELCAALKACALVVTNDTGPMHVAAALGTPVIVPFGSTSPELTGPVFTENSAHRLLIGAAPCAPCFLRECPIDFRCMKSISADQVVEAAHRVWTDAVGRNRTP